MAGPTELIVVPVATHLFEEPGTLDEVARLAASFFGKYLSPEGAGAAAARAEARGRPGPHCR